MVWGLFMVAAPCIGYVEPVRYQFTGFRTLAQEMCNTYTGKGKANHKTNHNADSNIYEYQKKYHVIFLPFSFALVNKLYPLPWDQGMD